MAWETILAHISVEVGEQTYEASIIRRGDNPHQTYHIMKRGAYQQFNGKGDDDAATVMGLVEFAMMLGREINEYAKPKGPKAEWV